jgi:DNA polymerase
MKLCSLNKEYDKLQKIYGDPNLHSIYNGGCEENPDICFVFMNPTGRNIASQPGWKGPFHPWLGTKQIWDLFFATNLIDEDVYNKIKSLKGNEWTQDFCNEVYDNVKKHKIFITNLGKCTQIDARPLKDNYFLDYLPLLEKEIKIIKPKVIVLFGNQVSSIFLNQKISVSQTRKQYFEKVLSKQKYKCFPIFYPVGNGRFNIDKSIEDINYIIDTYIKEK